MRWNLISRTSPRDQWNLYYCVLYLAHEFVADSLGSTVMIYRLQIPEDCITDFVGQGS